MKYERKPLRWLLLPKLAQRRQNQMQLPIKQPMPNKRIRKQLYVQRKEETTMNYDNRRLKEIQSEKLVWQDQLEKATSISDCLAYKGKLDLLESEEKEILSRCDVKI